MKRNISSKGYCIGMDERSLNLYLETNQITKIVRAKIFSTIHFASTTPLILVSFLYARTVTNKRSRSQSCKEEREMKRRGKFLDRIARPIDTSDLNSRLTYREIASVLCTDLVTFLVRIFNCARAVLIMRD